MQKLFCLSLLIFSFMISSFAAEAFEGSGSSCLYNFDFTHGRSQGFEAVFRDLPYSIYAEYVRRKNAGESLGPVAPLPASPGSFPEDETHWLLNSGIYPLPAPLLGTGFLLQSDNHSDDMDMYLVRLMKGFRPNSIYKIRIAVDLAGNAPHGAVGVGGDPELRIQAVLATGFNPTHYRIDRDKNVRHLAVLTRFPHAEVATNGVCTAEPESEDPCPAHLDEIPFELKTGAFSRTLTVRTDSRGQFWLMIGEHSPFESFSGIYYTRVQMQIQRGPAGACPVVDPASVE